MRLEPPSWWYRESPTLVAKALTPVARLVEDAAAKRWSAAIPYRATVPVVCIGNFTAGGAGKTPLAICLAGLLRDAGRKPGFLTRGYGGRLSGPHTVDLATDTARDTGDEALLLAAMCPAVLAHDRAAGARALVNLGADVIVMDDGLQNPQLAKQLSIAVLDPKRLIGNGLVLPAGPLRANLPDQLGRTDALVILCGGDEAMPELPLALRQFQGPVLRAGLVADGDIAARLRGQRVVAYAGIGRPSKLFDTLRSLDADVLAEFAFPDHHLFTSAEAGRMIARANEQRAVLVTTAKDIARTTGVRWLAELRAASIALPVAAHFQGRDLDLIRALLAMMLARGV